MAAFAGAGAVVFAAAEDVGGGGVGRGGFGRFRGEYDAGDCGCECLGDEEEFEGEGWGHRDASLMMRLEFCI